jgi:hypothetical protein
MGLPPAHVEVATMNLGLSTGMFTTVHVLISLIGIGAGFIALGTMIANRWSSGWNTAFFSSTMVTSVSGFLFPIKSLTPGIVIGLISVAILLVALFSLYQRRLAGMWQRVYTISAAFALYLNVFVGVVQAFQKVPSLRAIAPTPSAGAFVATQCVVLLLFAVLTYLAAKRWAPVSKTLALSFQH